MSEAAAARPEAAPQRTLEDIAGDILAELRAISAAIAGAQDVIGDEKASIILALRLADSQQEIREKVDRFCAAVETVATLRTTVRIADMLRAAPAPAAGEPVPFRPSRRRRAGRHRGGDGQRMPWQWQAAPFPVAAAAGTAATGGFPALP